MDPTIEFLLTFAQKNRIERNHNFVISTFWHFSRNKENLNECVNSTDVEVILSCADLNTENSIKDNSTSINYEGEYIRFFCLKYI